MYPNLYFAFLDLLGWDLPALKLINSFGFFVALAFLAAHALLKGELKRLAALGHFQAQTTTVTVGLPPNPIDLGVQALMGFVLGWKVLYLVVNAGDIFQGPGLPNRFPRQAFASRAQTFTPSKAVRAAARQRLTEMAASALRFEREQARRPGEDGEPEQVP